MKNQSVLHALSQLSDSLKLTFQLIGRLSKLSFQPGSTPLQGEDGDVRIELSNDIRDALKQHDDTLDALRQQVQDAFEPAIHPQRRRDSLQDRERARIAAQLARLEEDLKQYVSVTPSIPPSPSLPPSHHSLHLHHSPSSQRPKPVPCSPTLLETCLRGSQAERTRDPLCFSPTAHRLGLCHIYAGPPFRCPSCSAQATDPRRAARQRINRRHFCSPPHA
jgi:hypothetical protein